MIGVNGSRERQYTDEQLMSHLELVWRTVGYPPGKKIISKYGDGISEKQYKNRWGSLKKACELLSQYKSGTISWEAISPDKTSCELDSPTFQARKPLKQSLRFEVMKKDNNKCVKCGNSPPDCVLHVDHIIPLSKGGTDDINNLQTLCSDCNLGKSNRHMV
ncbi:MAG: HNH endonuclease [Nitrospirae bacterium]|nr:HNH endonuclease [Nitrospirota bacterium]